MLMNAETGALVKALFNRIVKGGQGTLQNDSTTSIKRCVISLMARTI